MTFTLIDVKEIKKTHRLDILKWLGGLQFIVESLVIDHANNYYNLRIEPGTVFYEGSAEEPLRIWTGKSSLRIGNGDAENFQGIFDLQDKKSQYPPLFPLIMLFRRDGMQIDTPSGKEAIKTRMIFFLKSMVRMDCIKTDYEEILNEKGNGINEKGIKKWNRNWQVGYRAKLYALVDFYGMALCLDVLYPFLKSRKAKEKVQEFCRKALLLEKDNFEPITLMDAIIEEESKIMALFDYYSPRVSRFLVSGKVSEFLKGSGT